MEHVDVVIVGGGLAGLTAALRLNETMSIQVLEEADYPGGRTLSIPTEEAWLNVGAQYVGGLDSPVANLARELGAAVSRIDEPTICMRLHGKIVKSRSYAGFLAALPVSWRAKGSFAWTYLGLRRERRAMLSEDRAVRTAARERLDVMSYGELWRGAHPEARRVMATLIRSLTVAEMDEVSAYIGLLNAPDVGGLRSEGTDPRDQLYCVAGGTGQIAQRIAERLGDGLALGAEVLGVRQGPEGVEVSYVRDGRQRTTTATRCVMATPATITARLCLNLPETKRRLLAAVPYAPLVLCAVELSEPVPPMLVDVGHLWDLDSHWHTIFNLGLAVGQQTPLRGGLLTASAMGQQAEVLLEKSDEELLDSVRETFDSLSPGISQTFSRMVVKRWLPGIPYWEPGRLAALPALRQSTGSVHFAGDYTDYGTMQGAVRSGERAAREVLGAGLSAASA